MLEGICDADIIYTNNSLVVHLSDHERSLVDHDYFVFILNSADYSTFNNSNNYQLPRMSSSSLTLSPKLALAGKVLLIVDATIRGYIFQSEKNVSLFGF